MFMEITPHHLAFRFYSGLHKVDIPKTSSDTKFKLLNLPYVTATLLEKYLDLASELPLWILCPLIQILLKEKEIKCSYLISAEITSDLADSATGLIDRAVIPDLADNSTAMINPSVLSYFSNQSTSCIHFALGSYAADSPTLSINLSIIAKLTDCSS